MLKLAVKKEITLRRSESKENPPSASFAGRNREHDRQNHSNIGPNPDEVTVVEHGRNVEVCVLEVQAVPSSSSQHVTLRRKVLEGIEKIILTKLKIQMTCLTDPE